jgi:malonyl-CoA/methylmalonyl-CoA synthetase
MRRPLCGSAPLSPSLAGRLPSVLGRLPLVRYGTTESGLNVSNPVTGPRGDTIGVPLPGVIVRIATGGGPADGLAELGADGEIQLRGPHVFSGYWNDPAATGAAFTQDGWFRTGDIGAVDPVSGHLVIRGRTKEMIMGRARLRRGCAHRARPDAAGRVQVPQAGVPAGDPTA